jgi:hypothetical protein
MAKKVSGTESVRNLQTYLESFGTEAEVPPEVAKACASQSGLASFRSRQKRIRAMSLNTLKATAVAVFGGDGWTVLDGLRRKLKGRCQSIKATSTRPGSERTPADRIAVLEDRLDQANRARFVLNKAYVDALSLLAAAAKDDARMQERLKRHSELYRAQLGLRIVPAQE